jgi:hypothetical protein
MKFQLICLRAVTTNVYSCQTKAQESCSEPQRVDRDRDNPEFNWEGSVEQRRNRNRQTSWLTFPVQFGKPFQAITNMTTG